MGHIHSHPGPHVARRPWAGHPCLGGLRGQATGVRNIAAQMLSPSECPGSALIQPEQPPTLPCLSVHVPVLLCVFLFPSSPPNFLGRLVHCLSHLSLFLSLCFNTLPPPSVKGSGGVCLPSSLSPHSPISCRLSLPLHTVNGLGTWKGAFSLL